MKETYDKQASPRASVTYFQFWNNAFNRFRESFVRGFGVVNCPECGKPLRKEREGESKYFCENERCNVTFVLHPCEQSETRIAYTGFARYKTAGMPENESYRHSIRQKLKLF